jgi:hypothetical protein
MTNKQQNELLLQSILGNGSPDHVSLPEQMVLGMNQFSGLYDDVEAEVNNDRNTSSADSPNEFDKKLKECFFPQKSSGGKLAIYANKSDGITTQALRAKTVGNPVGVSLITIMRGAKEVIKNGEKALACAKHSESEYRDGTLPSGKTLADYHKFIRQRMFVMLNGRTGDKKSSDKGDDDGKDSSESEKNRSGKGDKDVNDISENEREKDEDDNDDEVMSVEDDDMPEDYYFLGMIAFFLWGFIVNDSDEEYRSKQFQIDDTSSDQKGSNSRRQVRKETGNVASRERDAGAAAGSPFKRGITMNQQIEIAKLQVATGIEERKSLDQEFATEMHNLKQEIDNRIELLAKLWNVSDKSDPLFSVIKQLMAHKMQLTQAFKENQTMLNVKRQLNDAMMERAFVPSSKRFKMSTPTSTTTGEIPASIANSSLTAEEGTITSPEQE